MLPVISGGVLASLPGQAQVAGFRSVEVVFRRFRFGWLGQNATLASTLPETNSKST